MKDLARLRKLDEKAPEAMKSFRAFDQAALADGAFGAAETDYCGGRGADNAVPLVHRLHTKAAQDAGATSTQLAEAALVAAAIRAGGARMRAVAMTERRSAPPGRAPPPHHISVEE